MMFAHSEKMQAEFVGQLCFGNNVAQHLVLGEKVAVRVVCYVAESVETDFHVVAGDW
jgi:hypothetical protein